MAHDDPTVNLEGPLFSAPATSRGLNLGVFGKLTNTSERKERFNVTYSAHSDCDDKVYAFGGGLVNLAGGQAVFISTVWAIPAEACAGLYTIVIEVEDKHDASLTVSAQIAVD